MDHTASRSRGPAARSGAATAPHAWERWAVVWHALFYGTLAVATALALSRPPESRGAAALITALALALGAWYGLGSVAGRIEGRSAAWAAGYFAGAGAMWIGLVVLDPILFIVGPFLFAHICHINLRWASAAAALFMGGFVLRSVVAEGELPWQQVVAVALPILFGLLLARYVAAIARQSRERQRLIEELEATRAELAEAEHQAGALQERERLAREIHDALAQGFTSIVMLLETAEESLSREEAGARPQITQALRTARESLTEARRLVRALQPQPLTREPLPGALRGLSQRLSEETGLQARTIVTGTPRRLAAEAEAALLRVAQEALANVRKHSSGSRVTLTLSFMPNLAVLDVQDDGVGFRPLDGTGRAPGAGFGLEGMRRRVEQLGGSLTVESAPGEGTTLVAELPTREDRGVEEPEPAETG